MYPAAKDGHWWMAVLYIFSFSFFIYTIWNFYFYGYTLENGPIFNRSRKRNDEREKGAKTTWWWLLKKKEKEKLLLIGFLDIWKNVITQCNFLCVSVLLPHLTIYLSIFSTWAVMSCLLSNLKPAVGQSWWWASARHCTQNGARKNTMWNIYSTYFVLKWKSPRGNMWYAIIR